jgi:hypothetical protein
VLEGAPNRRAKGFLHCFEQGAKISVDGRPKTMSAASHLLPIPHFWEALQERSWVQTTDFIGAPEEIRTPDP